jgi:iron complex transport system permease protein
MKSEQAMPAPSLIRQILLLSLLLSAILVVVAFLGLAVGSSGSSLRALWAVLFRGGEADPVTAAIVWQIRLPRVVLAATAGSTLALGGLVFQALLRNPLAEPYILGTSGGAAVGAIIGMLAGLAPFPWVSLLAFLGSMTTLALVLALAGGHTGPRKDSLLLGGVMMNSFCGALIMFLISISQDSQVRHILFWLMGDLSLIGRGQLPLLLALLPGMVVIFLLARPMNLLLLGRETASSMGVNVRGVSLLLLVLTSFMVSLLVSQTGLIGFVGLVIPHTFRLLLGPDHRLLIPACLLGGAGYLIICDLAARTLPAAGEMPVGIITALIGAPLFIFLLWRSSRS